jgi:hypothetical protein
MDNIEINILSDDNDQEIPKIDIPATITIEQETQICKSELLKALDDYYHNRLNTLDNALNILKNNQNQNQNQNQNILEKVHNVLNVYTKYNIIQKIKESIDKEWTFDEYINFMIS